MDTESNFQSHGHYIDLRGHQVFNYEWADNGEAVVLLHGGLSQTSHWDYILVPDLEPEASVHFRHRRRRNDTSSRHIEVEDLLQEPVHAANAAIRGANDQRLLNGT